LIKIQGRRTRVTYAGVSISTQRELENGKRAKALKT